MNDALRTLNGYGPYVLTSFGLCVALMAVEVFRLRRRMQKSRAAAARSRQDDR